MRWSKIKDIIILILLITNGCLLLMVGLQAWQSRSMESGTGEKMVQVLEENGITYLPATVPEEVDLPSVLLQQRSWTEGDVELFLGSLTGSDQSQSRTLYRSDLGSALCLPGGQMELTFSAGALPLEGRRPEDVGVELLARLGLSAACTGIETANGVTTVELTQLWNGAPVPGWGGTLTCTESQVESLSLHVLSGTAEEQSLTGTPLTGATALARFLAALNEGGYVCTQVTDLYAGYVATGSQSVELAPTWFVESSTWPYRFQIDGLSGVLTVPETGRSAG